MIQAICLKDIIEKSLRSGLHLSIALPTRTQVQFNSWVPRSVMYPILGNWGDTSALVDKQPSTTECILVMQFSYKVRWTEMEGPSSAIAKHATALEVPESHYWHWYCSFYSHLLSQLKNSGKVKWAKENDQLY